MYFVMVGVGQVKLRCNDSTVYGAYTFGCCLGDGGCSAVADWPPSGLCW